MVPKFGVTDLRIFVFTLPDYREIGSKKKSADSKKSGSGTTALERVQVSAARTFLGLNRYTPILGIEGDIGWDSCQLRVNISGLSKYFNPEILEPYVKKR